MEVSDTAIQEIATSLISALPVEAEDDYQAWLNNPDEEGLRALLEKYHIDFDKIARTQILEDTNNA